MANYYYINRSVEAYEFRTIDPNNGQLRNILDITGSGGGGGGGSVDLSNYYTKTQTNGLFSPYYDSGEVDALLTSYYTKTETDGLFNPYYTKVETDNLFTPYYTKTETDNLFTPYYTKVQTDALFTPYYTKTETDNLFTPYYTKVETGGLMASYYTKTETDGFLNNKLNVSNPEITGVLKNNDFDSKNNSSNIQFKHNSAIYLEYDYDYDTNGGLVLGKPLALSTRLDIPLNSKLLFQHTDSYIDETLNSGNFWNFVMKEQTGQIDFYVGDPANASNLVMTLENDLITFHKATSPAIGGGGVDDTNLVKYTGETLQTIEGDLVIGGGSQFGSYDLTVNGTTYFSQSIELNLGVNINLGNNKGYIRSLNLGGGNHAYDYCNFSSGGLHRFYVGGSPFPQFLRFQLSSSQAYFYVNAVCNGELQTNTINTKDAGDSDLVFKRNNIEYMKFEGTLQAVEITQGAKSNTYDSIGNADVSFRRNTIDFMYLRNGNVEVNTGISLYAESGKFDTIDSATATDVVFKRGGVNFFTLDGTKNIIDVATGRALSSQYIYGDYFYNRNFGADMIFKGSNTTDDASVEYMRYKKADEVVNFSKDIHLNQNQKLYFHKATDDDVYIAGIVENGSNMLEFVNRDSIGQIRFKLWDGLAFATTLSMSWNNINIQRNTTVANGYSITGELVDTSDFTKKYDIKSVEHNFTDIVKQIEPKTFKLKDEKEIGITKNHLGFVADDLVPVIPPEFENIVLENDEGIKQLNYIKMNAILWGAVREQQTKIEHLESRLFEVENFIKDFVKPKAKAKSKSKN